MGGFQARGFDPSSQLAVPNFSPCGEPCVGLGLGARRGPLPQNGDLKGSDSEPDSSLAGRRWTTKIT
eukprot:10403355-Alexandrium_andersonii.AAC.1